MEEGGGDLAMAKGTTRPDRPGFAGIKEAFCDGGVVEAKELAVVRPEGQLRASGGAEGLHCL